MRKLTPIAAAMILGLSFMPEAMAQSKPESAGMSHPMLVTPYYFGPNAFPVPEMVTQTQPDLRVEASFNYFAGHRGDRTEDVSFKVNVPLFTPRVNLTVWAVAMEWWRNTDRNMEACGILPKHYESARSGFIGGDIYVRTDIQVLTEGRYRPGLTVCAGIKSASGGGYEEARYYDVPGYFFDACISKNFPLMKRYDLKLLAAVEGGFLCWQTDVARQNDAVMMGARLGLTARKWSLSETFGGYIGWEHHSCKPYGVAHDKPMVMKTDFTYHLKRFDLSARFLYGVLDYPYTQYSLAVAYNIPILKQRRCKEHCCR